MYLRIKVVTVYHEIWVPTRQHYNNCHTANLANHDVYYKTSYCYCIIIPPFNLSVVLNFNLYCNNFAINGITDCIV